MTLSQAKRTPPSHSSRSPHLRSKAESEAELYAPDFMQLSPVDPPPPDPIRVRRITLAVLLTLGVLMFLTAVMACLAVDKYADIVRYETESAAVENQKKSADQQTMLSQIESLEKAGNEENYRNCITEAKSLLLIPSLTGETRIQGKTILTKCQTQMGIKLLEKANQVAAKDQLRDAIAFANQVEGSQQNEAQQSIRTWSERIIKLAEDAYYRGELENAVNMAGAIAFDNPLYKTSQTAINSWRQDWAMDNAEWKMADVAVKADRLETARSHIKQLMASRNPYWRSSAQQLQADVDRLQSSREPSLSGVLTWIVVITSGWGWLSFLRGR